MATKIEDSFCNDGHGKSRSTKDLEGDDKNLNGTTNDAYSHDQTTQGKDAGNKMSPYAHSTQNSPAPSISNKEEPVRSYNLTTVRVLLPMITCFYFSHGAVRTVLFQYLLDRWSLEAGHNASASRSHSMCNWNRSDPASKQSDDIQARVAEASVYYTWCTTGPAFLTCLVFGSLVDLIGRKPAYVMPLLGTTLQILVVVLVMRFDLNPNLLYLAFTLDGIGGSFMLFLVANLSATADVSDTKKSRIAWITIVLTFSHIFTSATDIAIGLVINHFGYVAAGSMVFSTIFSGFLLAAIFLPETLQAKRRKITLKRMWDYNSRIVFLYTRDGSREARWSLFFALLIFSTSLIDYVSVTSTDTLYQKHRPLCWSATMIGYYSAFRNATRAILGLLYLGITRKIGCTSDEVTSMVGTLFLAGGFVTEAISRTDWEMFMAPIISIPSSIISPVIRGVMSFLAGPEKQGALFSSMALIEVFCVLIGRTTYSKIYAGTVAFMPGIVYFVMAATSLITFILYFPFFHFYERPPKKNESL